MSKACRPRPAPPGCPAPAHLPPTNPVLQLPFHSQFGEDEWLFSNLFYNKVNGFYLEMGAMDGTTYSNTRWLQQAAGWKGMLIEACPGGGAATAVAARQMGSRGRYMPSVAPWRRCLVLVAAPLDHPGVPPHC